MPSQPDTDRFTKRDIHKIWIPIGSVGAIILVIGGAAVTWATDRAELRSAKGTAENNSREISVLREDKARAEERNKALDQRLQNIETQLDRIADKIGVR